MMEKILFLISIIMLSFGSTFLIGLIIFIFLGIKTITKFWSKWYENDQLRPIS